MRRVLFLVFAACGSLPLRDGYLDEKTAALPTSVQAVISVNERVTGMLLSGGEALDPGIGSLDVVRPPEMLTPLSEVERPADVGRGVIVEGQFTVLSLQVTPLLRAPPVKIFAQSQFASLQVLADIAADNQSVHIVIDDPFKRFAKGRILRDFDSEVYIDDDIVPFHTTHGAELQWTLPLPREPSSVRVVTKSEFTSVTTTQWAKPQIARFDFSRAAKFEQSETVILPIFDLAIPDAERCATAKAQVFASFASLEKPRVLPAIGACAAIDEELTVEAVLTPFGGDITDPHTVLTVFYVSNASIPSEQTLTTLSAARGVVAVAGGRLDIVAVVANEIPGFFVASERWTYAADPGLADRVVALLARVYPYRRYAQSESEQVTLLPAAVLAGYLGVKVCSASIELAFERALRTPPYADIVGSFERSSGFLTAQQFDAFQVSARFEGCTSHCFEPPGASWAEIMGCAQ